MNEAEVRVYGRMQFADFVVSWALQSLSKSLQKVSDRRNELPGGLRCSDEKAIALTAERLLSLWQMAQWSVARLEQKAAQADLKTVIALCNQTRPPERQAAERLLERAEGKSAVLLTDLLATLDPSPPTVDIREQLGTLLRAESERWRSYPALRQISEEALLDHGMLRAFEKAHDLSRRLDRISENADNRGASGKRLQRAGRWVRHSVNHLELLRPALSEAGKTRRWHLNRLAAKLDDQWALERFARTAALFDLKPKASVRLDRLLQQQRRRLDKQRQKLAIGAFAGGTAAYRAEVQGAVSELQLETVTLLPVESLGTGSTDRPG